MTDWDTAEPPEREGGRVVIVMLLVLALMLGGGYAAAYVMAGNNVPHGTSVAGVGIGGRTQQGAIEALQEGLAERMSRPITVTIGGRSRAVVPSYAGLGVDFAASVAQAPGRKSWDPAELWDYYTVGDSFDAVVTVDETALTSLVAALNASFGRHPVDGTVSFRGGRVRTTAPREGRRLDPEQVRRALVAAYLQDEPTAELTLESYPPDIDDGDIQQALNEFANPAVSAPIALFFGDKRVRMHPREFTAALALRPHDGRLVPELDEAELTRLLDGAIKTNAPPADATVRIVDGRPRVIPARPGVAYDPEDVRRAFLSLVTRTQGKREIKVEASVARPTFTTRDARRLGIKQKVSTFTTYYPYAEYRNTNIGRAAELVNGTILKPGETFSLNRTVGERTRKNGFTDGFIISDGIFKEDLGGGVSQMATTTFNAMFFAGLKDIEHKPHSFYIDRYPVGREATVAWGSVDLRFQNDTPHGVLIEAHVTPSTPSTSGVVTVTMWSTKYWDITTTTGHRYNLTQPQTRTLHTADCVPNDGYGGFDIDITRHFRRHGVSALDHNEVMHTHYLPSDTVVCKQPVRE
ncbi:MAG TPA: VanW family protein [Nocardioides sp.]|nr:VanW family protein [Nocardioides sp.]